MRTLCITLLTHALEFWCLHLNYIQYFLIAIQSSNFRQLCQQQHARYVVASPSINKTQDCSVQVCTTVEKRYKFGNSQAVPLSHNAGHFVRPFHQLFPTLHYYSSTVFYLFFYSLHSLHCSPFTFRFGYFLCVACVFTFSREFWIPISCILIGSRNYWQWFGSTGLSYFENFPPHGAVRFSSIPTVILVNPTVMFAPW